MKIEKAAYKIAEFCEAFGICRTKTYAEIASGRLKAFKVGRMTLISQDSAKEWLRHYETSFPYVPGQRLEDEE